MKKPLPLIIAFAMVLLHSSTFGQFLNENFEGNTFPPANWQLTQVNSNETWSVDSKSANTGIKSATVVYDKSLNAQNELLISPSFDLTTAISPVFEFWVSMSYYWSVSPNDNYDFIVSLNDGTESVDLWTENNEGTFEDYNWRKVTIDLTDYVGKSNLKLEFKYVGTDGATLNLDDVSVIETAVLAVDDEISKEAISFYPNPVKNILSYQSNEIIDEITFYNAIGQQVYQSKNTNSQVDISKLNSGIYLLKVKSAEKIKTYKIVKE